MPLSAAVTTSKGVGAISSIQLVAYEAALLAEIVGKIFKPAGGKAAVIELLRRGREAGIFPENSELDVLGE